METSFFSKVLFIVEWLGAISVAIILIIAVLGIAVVTLKEAFVPALIGIVTLTVVGIPLGLVGMWAYSTYQADHPKSIVYNGTRYSVGQVVQGRRIVSFKKDSAGQWHAAFAPNP